VDKRALAHLRWNWPTKPTSCFNQVTLNALSPKTLRGFRQHLAEVVFAQLAGGHIGGLDPGLAQVPISVLPDRAIDAASWDHDEARPVGHDDRFAFHKLGQHPIDPARVGGVEGRGRASFLPGCLHLTLCLDGLLPRATTRARAWAAWSVRRSLGV
jgi:hypothetical protein